MVHAQVELKSFSKSFVRGWVTLLSPQCYSEETISYIHPRLRNFASAPRQAEETRTCASRWCRTRQGSPELDITCSWYYVTLWGSPEWITKLSTSFHYYCWPLIFSKFYYFVRPLGSFKRWKKKLKILEHSRQGTFLLNICIPIRWVNIFQPHSLLVPLV